VIARFEGVGLAKRAPHPYAAALYLDYMLGDAQDILAKPIFYTANTKIKPMPTDMTLTFLRPGEGTGSKPKME